MLECTEQYICKQMDLQYHFKKFPKNKKITWKEICWDCSVRRCCSRLDEKIGGI